MKTYTLIESVMNGTVTMDTWVSGVKASSYFVAVRKVQVKLKKMGLELSNSVVTPEVFRYTITGQQFPVCGMMKNKPMKFIK